MLHLHLPFHPSPALSFIPFAQGYRNVYHHSWNARLRPSPRDATRTINRLHQLASCAGESMRLVAAPRAVWHVATDVLAGFQRVGGGRGDEEGCGEGEEGCEVHVR